MPNWNEILNEIKDGGSIYDVVRRKYLAALHELTGRNVIIYYSGWLQGADSRGNYAINDGDKIGFMSACNQVEHGKGLDLVLHTPGGEIAATESIIDYLHNMYDEIRVIVPQLAMSGGTMIACSAGSIVMGKQSSLGPIDPQLGNLPAHGILEEFLQAHEEIKNDPSKIPVWQPIIAKYHPTLIGQCQKAIQWSEELVRERLKTGMLSDTDNPDEAAAQVVEQIGSHAMTKSHSRHLSADKCVEIGLKIEKLEENQDLQDAVLSVHHACMHTLSNTGVHKIIENHNGVAYISSIKQLVLQAGKAEGPAILPAW